MTKPRTDDLKTSNYGLPPGDAARVRLVVDGKPLSELTIVEGDDLNVTVHAGGFPSHSFVNDNRTLQLTLHGDAAGGRAVVEMPRGSTLFLGSFHDQLAVPASAIQVDAATILWMERTGALPNSGLPENLTLDVERAAHVHVELGNASPGRIAIGQIVPRSKAEERDYAPLRGVSVWRGADEGAPDVTFHSLGEKVTLSPDGHSEQFIKIDGNVGHLPTGAGVTYEPVKAIGQAQVL